MIRVATAADLSAIMEIEIESFPSDAWAEDLMLDEITSEHNVYFVSEHGGRIAGYAGLRALRGNPDGDIQTIAVNPALRGLGTGRSLLRRMIREADSHGVRTIFLDVREDNAPAEKLYLSEGFAACGRRPRYYQPDDVDAIVMQLDVPRWRGENQ